MITHLYFQANPVGRFINGNVHDIGSGQGLTIKVDHKDLNLLSGITVDAAPFPAGTYAANVGGGEIILSSNYLSTFSAGTYTLKLAFADRRHLELAFTITGAWRGVTGAPKTGDASNELLWMVMSCTALCAMAYCGLYLRKKLRQ